MPRIRTIKPEFWSSPSMRDLDPWARLLFIAMWNWADDSGRGVANARELAAFAFPDEDDTIAPTVAELPTLLAEIRGRFGVVFYTVGGRRYYEIPTWDKHQRNEKRAKSKHPGPDEGHEYDPGPPDQGKSEGPKRNAEVPPHSRGSSATRSRKVAEGAAGSVGRGRGGASSDTCDDPALGETSLGDNYSKSGPDLQVSEVPPHSSGNTAESRGSSGTGTGEQGNRGTGEEETFADLPVDGATLIDFPKPEPKPTYPEAFEHAWKAYGRKGAKKTAYAEWQRALKRASVDTITEAIGPYVRSTPEVRFRKDFERWLKGDCWESAIVEHAVNSHRPYANPNPNAYYDEEL